MNRIIKMKRLRAKGFTLRQIGEEFCISRERVRQLIGNTGYTTRYDIARKNREVIAEDVHFYKDMTQAQAARKYNVSESFIRKLIGPRHKYLSGYELKQCYACGNIIHRAYFGKNQTKKDGLNNVCKECNSSRSKKYYADVTRSKRRNQKAQT